eukprot:4991504-Pyramimonas_sp.AAC.4
MTCVLRRPLHYNMKLQLDLNAGSERLGRTITVTPFIQLRCTTKHLHSRSPTNRTHTHAHMHPHTCTPTPAPARVRTPVCGNAVARKQSKAYGRRCDCAGRRLRQGCRGAPAVSEREMGRVVEGIYAAGGGVAEEHSASVWCEAGCVGAPEGVVQNFGQAP